MGRRARQPLTVCDTDSIAFTNELFFVESEIMDLYKEHLNIDPRDDTYSEFSEDEQVERYATNYRFWRKLYEVEISKQPPHFMKEKTHIPLLYYITKKTRRASGKNE